jgi:hypothetical protein
MNAQIPKATLLNGTAEKGKQRRPKQIFIVKFEINVEFFFSN